jgi:two-component system chemotaxis response regulator CheB
LPKIRVLVVDDAVVIRRLLADALAQDPDVEVVGVAANGKIALQRVRDDLVPRLKVLTGHGHAPHIPPPALPGTASAPVRPPRPSPVHPARAVPAEVVTIGTSTGGPNALAAIFAGLPPDWSLPLLIVQHMPPMFTRLLAERLHSQSPLTVVEAAAGMEVQPRHAYIAPGDYHMAVEKAGTKVRIVLNQETPEHSVRPAVDVLFRSVADVYGARSIAVVLTGMGQDGLRGTERIHAAGGRIFAQDEATSVVWGMPSFIARAGLAEKVLPLDQVAVELARIAMGQKGERSAMLASSPAATRIQP